MSAQISHFPARPPRAGVTPPPPDIELPTDALTAEGYLVFHEVKDGLNSARGIWNGVLIASLFWLSLAAIVWRFA